ncbi:MAG: hypothetical protein GX638_10400, partial [Crenarchaeota archaeon]|nr:hypothetical protein [Thermoproteota archaeon]
MDNVELKWISQKIFSYQDPDTTVILNVLLDSGIIEDEGRNTYHSPRVLFQLRDNRSQSSKIQIELQFLELSSFVEQIKRIIDAGIQNVLEQKTSIPSFIAITKYGSKNKKDLVLSVCKNQSNIPYVQLEISDPLGKGITKSIIFIDISTFFHLYTFCSQIRNNYANISISFLNALIQEKVLDEIRLLQNIKPIFQSVPRDSVEFEEPIITSNIENSIQDEFNKIGNNIFTGNIQTNENTISKTESVTKPNYEQKIEKTEMPFIGTFLDYDPFKLNEWVSAFLCANEKSVAISFCPLNNIISRSLKEKPFNYETSGFFSVQYFLDVMFRRSVSFYLKTGKFVSYPIFKMPEQNAFKQGTEIFQLSEEVLFCYLLYTNLYDCYFQYIQNNPNNQKHITEISIVQQFLRSYLSFFFVSMEKNNIKDLKDDLLIILDKCSKNGFLKKISEFYKEISSGGTIDFSQRMMETYFSSMLEELNNINTFSVSDVKNVFKENYITEVGQI